jgi:hypothetical protein
MLISSSSSDDKTIGSISAVGGINSAKVFNLSFLTGATRVGKMKVLGEWSVFDFFNSDSLSPSFSLALFMAELDGSIYRSL